jgi:hypothetical protein
MGVNIGGASQLPQHRAQQLDIASVQTGDGNTAGQGYGQAISVASINTDAGS